MLKLFWLAIAAAVASVAILAGLYLPGAPTEPLFWVPFVLAFASFAPVLYQINGRVFGNVRVTEVWELLRELPVSARIFLGLLLVASMAQLVLGQAGVVTELDFKRTFASVAVWICSCAAAMAYALQRRRSRTDPLQPSLTGWRKKLFYALYIGIGLVIALGFFLVQRDGIHDEDTTHQRLSVAFGHASWYAHLVAANTYHGGFVVYLDTRDPAIQAAACSDLRLEAARLNRSPVLYYATAGRGRFDKAC